MDRDIKKYRKDIMHRREEILEDYYLYYIDKKEYEFLMDELDDFENQVDELEEKRKTLKELKKEQRKINSKNIISK